MRTKFATLAGATVISLIAVVGFEASAQANEYKQEPVGLINYFQNHDRLRDREHFRRELFWFFIHRDHDRDHDRR